MAPVKWLLVYPSGSGVALASLGFQWVAALLEADERIQVTRAVGRDSGLRFLDDPEPVAGFHVLAFSISYEMDYLTVLRLLRDSGLPMRARDRKGLPLVVAGGIAVSANPTPLDEFVDLALIGEAESLAPPFIDGLVRSGIGDRKTAMHLDKRELLAELARLPGVYCPSGYDWRFASDGALESVTPEPGFPARVTRVWDRLDAPACVGAPPERSVFGDSALIELVRGCGCGCRFCLAGYAYRRPRAAPADAVGRALGFEADKIGFIGASVLDAPDLESVITRQLDAGRRVAFSSMRADRIGDRELSLIERAGLDTVTLAPEAAAEPMRRTINKRIEPGTYERVVADLARIGVGNIKLYFMLGLPGEEDADARAVGRWLVDLNRIARQARPGTRVRAGIAPLTPKPHTPFQWAAMAEPGVLKRRYGLVRQAARPGSGIEIGFDSIPLARVHALLSRGDRRLAPTLEAGALGGRSALNRGLKALDPDLDWQVHRVRGRHEPFPWEVVHMGVDREFLYREWESALAREYTPSCSDRCVRCGVCGPGGRP